ncbi:LysR family transcriptional regulator [Primorskyibacter aestuariivivens]|uniref:LysR family transcriptional regulator n=1 Tax=Primorskyibacter aestuariivivens TaxID=1888912 RepID=UPI0023014EA7|nr:LysR family transcriptional regulator [Primorskyibacter aestuariivivens]MDA7430931.1 LysR family transcriptional regulator [Primorskyibacter aestuariivivens]
MLYLRSLRPVQLRLVDAVARLGKLRLAADACSMTTPAASRMLADIETQLGTALFERTPKGMLTTPAGSVLATHTRKLVHDIDQMANDFAAHMDGTGGSVRVGAVTGGALAALIPAILDLKQDAPLVDVSLDVASSAQLMRGLEAGEYDFTLSRVGPHDYSRDFEIHPARNESVLLMVRRGHPMATTSKVQLRDLLGCLWTMQDRGAPIRHAIEIAFHEEGIDIPASLIKTASVVAIMALLRDSDVIAVVTEEVADLLLSPPFSADLVLLNTAKPISIEPYYILCPRDRLLSAAAQRLLDLVQARIRN